MADSILFFYWGTSQSCFGLFVLVNSSVYICTSKLLDVLKLSVLEIDQAGQLRDVCAMKWAWDSGILTITLKIKKGKKEYYTYIHPCLDKSILLRRDHMNISAIIF